LRWCFSRDRDRIIRLHLARRGISDPHVLEAMRCVPREAFVPKGLEEFAYDDLPLPIGEGQTISQPYIVALMIEAAEIEPRRSGAGDRGRLRLRRRGDEPDRRSCLHDRAPGGSGR
jgi:hypothetical protein